MLQGLNVTETSLLKIRPVKMIHLTNSVHVCLINNNPFCALNFMAHYPLYIDCMEVVSMATNLLLHTLFCKLKTFSVDCHYCLYHCCKCSLAMFTFCNQFMFLTWFYWISRGKSAVDYIWFWDSLEFPASIIHAHASAVTLGVCCMSDAYPRGLPMQASTSCQDTGRRTWHLPCWSWLSCLHLSVETRNTDWDVTLKCNRQHFLILLFFRQHNSLKIQFVHLWSRKLCWNHNFILPRHSCC